jgi:UDP-N-acetylmuramyl pentapeptide phosphotransferase/UDP-N-acetylglucosamine-1-phosphate transferase
MTFSLVAQLFLGCALLTTLATGCALFWLRRRSILDHPNERSSHVMPTPRGGGLAVVPVVLLAWIVASVLGVAPHTTLVAVAGAAFLGYVSWRDDRGGVRIAYRLLAQFAAIGVGLALLPGVGHVFSGLLPPTVDIAASAILWVWFVNLFNFMDGIDGLTAVETLALGAGVALVAFVGNDYQTGALPLGITLAAAALGFLPWNWQPARLFLGDVGSVPIGYLGGWLLLGLAARGAWAPALIIPLYYLVDASLTLVYRAIRLRPVWQAHREHAYQRAVALGRSHAGVATRILAADVGLILLALLATWWPVIASCLAVVLVLSLIFLLLRPVPARVAP